VGYSNDPRSSISFSNPILFSVSRWCASKAKIVPDELHARRLLAALPKYLCHGRNVMSSSFKETPTSSDLTTYASANKNYFNDPALTYDGHPKIIELAKRSASMNLN